MRAVRSASPMPPAANRTVFTRPAPCEPRESSQRAGGAHYLTQGIGSHASGRRIAQNAAPVDFLSSSLLEHVLLKTATRCTCLAATGEAGKDVSLFVGRQTFRIGVLNEVPQRSIPGAADADAASP